MKLILFVAILKLFIVNTVQNLIRFGDFQKILPSYPIGAYSFSCKRFCNGIWYDGYSKEVQLKVIVDKFQTQTYVDMVYYNYSQLCQNFTAVDIGKTYKYTFETRCNQYRKIVKNCSAWVILNGKTVNGSNQTHTDYMVHRNLGYLNITQKNNTICFQTREAPFFYAHGTDLDNVVLQIYSGKIPCNVTGCKLCVLNFPNICQVFQQISPPEMPEESQGRSCDSKFYLNGNSCKICLFPCQTCQRQARNCLSCPNFYLLQGNQCVIVSQLTSVASAVASIPGIEFFSIGQIFLGILNQFWPYYSHHRIYGQQTDEILTFFHTLQNNKWFLLSLEKKIDFKFQSMNFSDYSEYSNQQFLKMESRTSYFWDGAFELVFFSFPTMLVAFFIFNLIFCLTFKYRISKLFRPFSFLLMIYFLGIGDDISYLSFLSFSNGMNLFSFKFQDKLGHIVWILVFFLLVLFCSAGHLVAKFFYNKLSKYFIDDFFPKLQSFHIQSLLSMKSLMIGSINALLARNYEMLIISLASIEMVFLIGVVYVQWKNICYKIQTFMFLQILKSIIMTVFNVSLWIDFKIRKSQQEQIDQQSKKLSDLSSKVLIIAIIGLGVLQAISKYFSGRGTVNHRQKKQVPKTREGQRQVLKIINLKSNTQDKNQIALKNYIYQTEASEKAGKTQNSKKIKIKQPLKRNRNALHIIQQQDQQNEIPVEVISIKG